MAESSTDLRYIRVTLPLLILMGSAAAVAQPAESYVVPRTVYDQPDFQGVWGTDFATTLERPEGVEGLIATPRESKEITAAFLSGLGDNIDPDVVNYGSADLAQVNGEYRTSIIVEPEDGQMPLSEAGLELVAWALKRDEQMFDSADQRPLAERCLEWRGDSLHRIVEGRSTEAAASLLESSRAGHTDACQSRQRTGKR